jgi:anti-sigma regulatory factor (Ser/Thr protein kinase)
MKELTVDAIIDNIPTVTDFVSGELEAKDCPAKVIMKIEIAIDELFGNIANYAYKDGTGKATVSVDVLQNPSTAVVTFIDQGIPYNPLTAKEPDITLSALERPIGGLGIYMVKKSMDEVNYEYKDGNNVLQIKKLFN